MQSFVIHAADLAQRQRWDPKSVISRAQQAIAIATPAARATTPVGALVVERKNTAQPPLDPSTTFIYVGLENVESRTGDLVGEVMRRGGEVRSRSKLYRHGDVLFGRLRPNLAKVFYCDSPEREGYCSSEFLVLRPRAATTSGRILRQLLSSSPVISQVSQWIAGAALPRAPIEALLSVQVPVIDSTRTEEVEAELLRAEQDRARAKALLSAQPGLLDALVWQGANESALQN